MHELLRTDDCIYRADVPAMHAADTQRFIYDRNRFLHSGLGRLREWDKLPAQQIREASHRVLAPRRTQVDFSRLVNDRGRIRPASRKAALSALRLR